MTNVNPLATASAVSLLCLLGVISGRARSAPPPALSGVLYSAVADSTTAVEAQAPTLPPLPQLEVSVPASQRAAFPEGTSAVVHFVAHSSYTLTVATKTTARPSRRAARSEAPPLATTPRPSPPAPPPPPSLAARSAPLNRPAPAQPESFEDYEDALRRSETTQTINARLSRGGVTFRLTQVGLVGSEAVVRYAIANAGSSDFFVSVVNVYAGGAPIPSETTGRYACRPGNEIYGVTHFASAAVAGKKVSVELVESGGAGRRFLLAVDHAF